MNRLAQLVELQKLDAKISTLLHGAFESDDDFDALDKIDKIKRSRATMSKKLDPMTMKRYERLRSRKKDTLAVVPVVNGVCSGCNITISTSTMALLHREEDAITCENCGRFVYVSKVTAK